MADAEAVEMTAELPRPSSNTLCISPRGHDEPTSHVTDVPPDHWGLNEYLRLSIGRSLVNTAGRVNYHVFSNMQRWLAGSAVLGAIVIGCLNIVVVKIEKVCEVVDPKLRIWSPMAFFLVAIVVAILGCKTNVISHDEKAPPQLDDDQLLVESTMSMQFGVSVSLDKTEVRRLSTISSFTALVAYMRSLGESVQAGGAYFHRKVFFLQIVKMLNMSLVLKANLETGQAKHWIVTAATLILINSIVVPLLLFKADPKYHTIGLVLWDLGMDALYGALLPLCMVAYVTAETMQTNEQDLLRMKKPTAEQAKILAVATRYVPRSYSDLVQAIVPYASFIVRMGDVKKARYLQKRRALPLYCGTPLLQRHHQVVRTSFGLSGLALFVATLWRLYIHLGCANSHEKWSKKCLHETYFTFQPCRCIYFHYEATVTDALRPEEVAALLHASGEYLRILSYWNYGYSTFPSLRRNPSLVWLFLEGGLLKEMPDLSANTKLERLVVREQKLVRLENIAQLEELKWLDVQSNELDAIPDLDGNKKLLRVMMSHNDLKELPSISMLTRLTKLRASYNKLRHFPSTAFNKDLIVLDLIENELTELLPLNENGKLRELKLSSNRLTQLPALEWNRELRWLEVTNNQLTSLPDLSSTNIWFLNVSGNNISRLPRPLDDLANGRCPANADGRCLANLTKVDICNNPVATMQEELNLNQQASAAHKTANSIEQWECRGCRVDTC